MVRHCPTCNRSSDEVQFFGEFCEFCTIDRLGKKLPEEIKITVCKRCGRIKVNNDFVDKDDAAVEVVLQKAFRDFDLKLISALPEEAIVKLDKHDQDISGIRRQVALKYQKVMCPKCNRQSAGYYEGIIQLRGNPEKAARMLHRLEKYYFERDEFISRMEKVNNGVDLYVSSKKLATAFIAERGLKAVMSYELYGLKHGKKLYRNTYSLHFD
ncbi:MAG: NMD3-related protein [Candidatus Micrarchaeales archaeon]